MEDPRKCAEGVETYWGKIAKIIFSERASGETCHALSDQCAKPPGQRYIQYIIINDLFIKPELLSLIEMRLVMSAFSL